MATASSDDVRKAVNTALEQVKTSLLAALGAGNLASQAVVDAVGKARERVTEGGEAARKNIEELPSEVEGLREKLEPSELRKVLDDYTDAALKLYHKLAESGEETLEKLRAQPQLQKSIEQLENVTGDARERVDDVLTKVTGRTREAGKEAGDAVTDAAAKVEETASKVADRVDEARPDTTSAKPASKSTAARKTTSTARKNTGGTSKTTK